jgi:DNA-binding response OmpR family regulator
VADILVVDDDPDIRLLLRLELGAEGHSITEAGDGRAALDALAARRVDLVLLDMMMPVLDGWEVLRSLDASAPPVLVVTALGTRDNTHVVDLLELGALDIVAKPFDPGWLLGLVGKLLALDDAGREDYRRGRLAEARTP